VASRQFATCDRVSNPPGLHVVSSATNTQNRTILSVVMRDKHNKSSGHRVCPNRIRTMIPGKGGETSFVWRLHLDRIESDFSGDGRQRVGISWKLSQATVAILPEIDPNRVRVSWRPTVFYSII